MELVVSKWERVCRSLQIYVALKCRQPWQEIRDGKKASLSSFSQKSVEEMNMDALRREGKEIQGADEVPKGCVWTVPELFSLGRCQSARGCHGACRKHMQT